MIEIKFEKENKRAIAIDKDIVIGECDYIENEKYINIVHTEVGENYKGQGIARKLVECVINNVNKYNKNIIADCSYARKIIENR